jgi:hypothetical protein
MQGVKLNSATAWGWVFTNFRKFLGDKLFFTIRWILRYKKKVSVITNVSVNPTISSFSIFKRKSLHTEKYFSSLRRKYKKMLVSMKTERPEGILLRDLVNTCLLFGKMDNFLDSFVTGYFFYHFSNLGNNSRLGFFNKDRNFLFFHYLTSFLKEGYHKQKRKSSFEVCSSQGKEIVNDKMQGILSLHTQKGIQDFSFISMEYRRKK